jgi:hypothetical protein
MNAAPASPTLWDIAPPARAGHRTQAGGARAIAARAPTIRERVLAYIRARRESGATNEEISNAVGLRIQTVCGRMGELKARGEIRDSGATRENVSGVQAIVWVAADNGGDDARRN